MMVSSSRFFFIETVLHIWIVRSTTTFWRDPDNVLRRVLDVAGLAVDAVLRVDLQTRLAGAVFDEFINPRRTVATLRPSELGQVDVDRNRGIGQRQVSRLVLFVVGVRDKHRRQAIEGQYAIRLGVLDFWRFCRWLQARSEERRVGEL